MIHPIQKITLALFAGISLIKAAPESPSAKFYEPVVRQIEGWTVNIDPKMLAPKNAAEDEKALKMLANHLQRIVILVPADRLEKLRKVQFWIEHDTPTGSVELQYHPDVAWLKENGYNPKLVKKVHISRAATLLDRRELLKHPAVVLHELAHAYHDQVLGFDDKRIIAAYQHAMKAGLYDNVLIHTGKKGRAYATTNHKEYFAEVTEAYFYKNDISPFVHAELEIHDPEVFKLLEKIWGPADSF